MKQYPFAENLFTILFYSSIVAVIGIAIYMVGSFIKDSVKKPKPNYPPEADKLLSLDEFELKTYHDETTVIDNPRELLSKLREPEKLLS